MTAAALKLEQRTTEWHEWRSDGIGASEIAAVLGISPWKTAYQLWLEKTGKVVPFGFQSDAMKRGVELESAALFDLETELGVSIDTANTVFEHEEYPFIRASLDGIVDDAVVEIKVPGVARYEAMKHGIPDYYMAQLQQQMLVAGKPKALFWVWSDENGGYLHQVAADEKWQSRVIKAAVEFWRAVESGTWPRDEMSELVEDLAQRKKRLEEAKQEYEAAQERLVALMEERSVKKIELPSGIKATVTSRAVVDKEACMKDERYVALLKTIGEAKEMMKPIEEANKVKGKPYIRLSLPV